MGIKSTLKKSKVITSCYHWCQKSGYEIATAISPRLNTRIRYRQAFKKKWDPDNPITLNDKIHWLKLNTYYKNPVVKQCADKYKVREYIEEKGCSEILNDLIAVYEKVEDIEWDALPDKFAMKLNVGCGFNIIVNDKSKLDISEAKKKLKKWMREKYYLLFAEMQYKGVKPYIVVEKYLEPKTGILPEDYKVYCMNGKPVYIFVCVGREHNGRPKFYFFDTDWNLARINKDSINAPEGFTLERPSCLDELLSCAKKLSEPFPFVRADFYIVNDKVYFGELTFSPSGGLDMNRLPETDLMLGEMVDLSYDPQKNANG